LYLFGFLSFAKIEIVLSSVKCKMIVNFSFETHISGFRSWPLGGESFELPDIDSPPAVL
jgi:hypothetical protein